MRRLNTFIASLLLTSALTPPVYAQSPVSVIGPVTPGDCAAFSSNTVLKDAGLCGGGSGTDSNVLNAQTANYAIASTDCGKTIYATGGQFTITLPSVSGFAATCSVLIKNGDTGNAKLLSGFPADMDTRLWPDQTVGVKIENGVWAVFYNPGRWQLTANTTFYVNGTGGSATCGLTGASTCVTGSDNNDCLSASSPCNTSNKAVQLILAHIDVNGFTPTVNLAHGSTTNNAVTTCTGSVVGLAAIYINGDSTAKTAAKILAPNGSYGATATDLCFLILENLEVDDQGSAAGGVHAAQAGIMDLQNVTFGAFNSGAALMYVESPGAKINNLGGNVISGGAAAAFVIQNNGCMDFASTAFSIPNSNITFTQFFQGASSGCAYHLQALASAFTGAGASSVIGIKAFLAASFSLQSSGVPCNSIFPGNSNCQILQYATDDANDPMTTPPPLGGATCTLTTVSHLTVVSGVVTLCN